MNRSTELISQYICRYQLWRETEYDGYTFSEICSNLYETQGYIYKLFDIEDAPEIVTNLAQEALDQVNWVEVAEKVIKHFKIVPIDRK